MNFLKKKEKKKNLAPMKRYPVEMDLSEKFLVPYVGPLKSIFVLKICNILFITDGLSAKFFFHTPTFEK